MMSALLDSVPQTLGMVEHNWIILVGCFTDGSDRYDSTPETEATIAPKALFVGPNWFAWPCKQNDSPAQLTVR